MPTSSSSAWAVWLVIGLFIFICIGIIIWFSIDSIKPDDPFNKQTTNSYGKQSKTNKTVVITQQSSAIE